MNAYSKNVARTILNNFRRYFSMVLITAMGVAFFVGLRSTSPDMNYTLDRYFSDHGMYDLRLMTSLGITAGQAEGIAAIPGVERAVPAYYCDMFITLGTGSSLARLHSLEADTEGSGMINTPMLAEGRFPEAADECLVEWRYLTLKGAKLGDTVTVATGSDDPLDDTLYRGSYRIVGAIESPVYISPILGSSSKGSGKLDTYMYIPEENFVSDIYTEVYISAGDARLYSRFSGLYGDLLGPLLGELEAYGELVAANRYSDIMSEGGQKIEDGKREIDDAKKKLADAEREISDAYDKIAEGETELSEKTAEFEAEISDAEKELADARVKLDDAWLEIEDARQELEDGKADLKELRDGLTELADELEVGDLAQLPAKMRESLDLFFDGERELFDADYEIASGRRKLAKSRIELEEAEDQLDANAGALAEARETLTGLRGQLEQVKGGKAQLEQSLAGVPPDMIPPEVKAQLQQLVEAEAQLEGGISQIEAELARADAAREQIEDGWRRLSEGGNELDKAEREYRDGKRKLDDERASLLELADELEAGRIEALPERLQELLETLEDGEREIADGEAELADAEQTLTEKTLEYEDGLRELEDGRAEGLQGIAEGREKLADARVELEDGSKKYDDAKAEADEKLPEAERDIADAEKKLAGLDEPKSYALDLDSNIGFVSFKQDSERIDKISLYFPLIFFLVAALVSFTSMVRVVEHDRPAIGALQSLGYRPAAILRKYVIFALAVCVPGCGLGIAVGYRLFPAIIFNRGYKILYTMPSLITPVQPRFCALAFGISLLSVMLPTIMVCMSELRGTPAMLLRPKPPRSGRYILLERVHFIWSRMSFSAKVTARNILRYKRRFAMTLTGVAGCAALVLTGFGLRDSIGGLAANQFGAVFHYDLEVTLKEKPNTEDIAAAEQLLDGDPRIAGYTFVAKGGYECRGDNGIYDVTVCVPQDTETLPRYISLNDAGGNELGAGGGGVVITEKLSRLTGVKQGGELVINDADGNEFRVGVRGVSENYLSHYIYMNADQYREVFGANVEWNGLLCLAPGLDADAEQEISTALLDNGAVTGVSYLSTVRDYYTDMLNSLDVVVLVLLIAGALLSFIVLFSLTGINVDERQRELATLKVLGFYDNETAGYIFRENIVSTFVGTAVGLPAGIALHRFVMSTAELDMIMFGRDIHPFSFLATAALSFVFLGIVNWVMGFNIRKIDMIESLKSVE